MHTNLFDYLDYRQFLQDWLQQKKAESSVWSHRMVAEKVGLKSGGHISLILNGKANLKEAALEAFIRLLKLTESEKNYFRNLVLYNQAEDHLEQKAAYERLLACQNAKVTVLQADQYAYYSRWYYSAVREALRIFDFKGTEFQELGAQMIPALSSDQVREAFEFLKRLQLVALDTSGYWKATEQILSTGPQQNGLHFNEHVFQILDLARCAIQRVPTGEKYNSWISMAIGPDSFTKIVEELRSTRNRILKIVEDDPSPQRVFHLNLNLFPFTQKRKRKTL
jgi:uncharacterized protein (TIGR02147 family)